MSVFKRNDDAVEGETGGAVKWIGRETRLCLLAIRDDR